MKFAVTCIHLQLEVTPYNDKGQAMPRPRVEPLVIYESAIPEEVSAWLQKQVPAKILEVINGTAA